MAAMIAECTSMNPSRRYQQPFVVALTGGVASGKTAISSRLAAKGAPVVDTDVIARQVVAPGSPGLAAIVEAFGTEVLDEHGQLARRRLRDKVFERPEARQRLEHILHPLIAAEARRQIATHEQADYVVVVVPLLAETGRVGDADCVVVVDVPESTQIRRLQERDGIERQQAEAMLAAQATRQQRLAMADEVIDNTGSLDTLKQAVDELHDRLVRHSQHRHHSNR